MNFINIKTTAILMILISIFQTACEDFNKFYEQRNAGKHSLSKQYVARVGKNYITSEDMKYALKEIPFKQRVLVESSESAFNNFLKSYINKELLYNQALDLGLEKRADVREKSENYLKNLLISKLTEELQKNEISEDEVINYYRSNINKFMNAKVTIISLYKDNNTDDEELHSVADDLRMKWIDGLTIDEIRNYLDNKNSIRYKIKKDVDIPKYHYDNDVAEIIFKLKPKEISLPVYLNNSYNIYKLEDKPATISYINAKNQIKYKLRSTSFREYLNTLKNEQGYEIYISNYKEIK